MTQQGPIVGTTRGFRIQPITLTSQRDFIQAAGLAVWLGRLLG